MNEPINRLAAIPEPELRLPRHANGSSPVQTGTALLAQFQTELAVLRNETERLNTMQGLQGVIDAFNGGGNMGHPDQSAAPYTLANANNYNPITLNRILLSYTYMSQGLATTLVDQPVEDAFRGGIKFKSSQLDDEELDQLNRRVRRKQKSGAAKNTPGSEINPNAGYNLGNSDLEAAKLAMKWARLFGGSGIVINTDQDFSKPLRPEAIREDSPLQFIAADRWELTLANFDQFDESKPTPFNYYGLALDRSRVVKMIVNEAPSFIRMRLQGWGMSILENSIRAISAFLKFEALLFELLDEAKIDVYKIKGFNANLLTQAGTDLITRRVTLANQLKNYQSALTMDMEDDYVQKQLSFAGIAELWDQFRQNLCAYLKFPKNKLFGEGQAGFGSGKDSLDNYNATVGNLREQGEPLILAIGELRCQQLFGMIPDDLEAEWTPLAVLDGVETETVKTSAQNRITQKFTLGLTTGQEASEELRKGGLLDVADETEVEQGLRDAAPPPAQNPEEAEAGRDHDLELSKAKAKPPAKKD